MIARCRATARQHSLTLARLNTSAMYLKVPITINLLWTTRLKVQGVRYVEWSREPVSQGKPRCNYQPAAFIGSDPLPSRPTRSAFTYSDQLRLNAESRAFEGVF